MTDNKDKFANLFGYDDNDAVEGDILLVDYEDLVPFSNHLFSPYTEETMNDLARSIDDMGQLSPCLVREHPSQADKYEILSGHNRAEACRRLGIQVKVIVHPDDLTDNQAKLIVIESNIKQRTLQSLAMSEQAKIIAEHHRLLRHQGKRNDLAKSIDNLDESDKTVDADTPYNLSKRQINRYVRIDEHLSDALKILLDEDKLTIKAANELSFIEEDDSQDAIAEYIENGHKITEAKASKLRKAAEDDILDVKQIETTLSNKKVDKKVKVMLPDSLIVKFFSNMNHDEIIDYIEKAVIAYQQE